MTKIDINLTGVGDSITISVVSANDQWVTDQIANDIADALADLELTWGAAQTVDTVGSITVNQPVIVTVT